jgi:hypothetical protein
LYPHWEVQFVSTPEELVSKWDSDKFAVVSLAKIKTYKIVNILREIPLIYLIEVAGFLKNTMYAAQRNSEKWAPFDVSEIENYMNLP